MIELATEEGIHSVSDKMSSGLEYAVLAELVLFVNDVKGYPIENLDFEDICRILPNDQKFSLAIFALRRRLFQLKYRPRNQK